MTAIVLPQTPLSLHCKHKRHEHQQETASAIESRSVLPSSLDGREAESLFNDDDLPEKGSISRVPSLDDECTKDLNASVDETMEGMAESENDSSKDDPMETQSDVSDFSEQLIARNRKSYGGLSNLGNTCYMASALQMLASLEQFVQCLHDEEPPRDDATESCKAKLRLRRAFLDLMRRTAAGETFAPTDFKSAIDERSPLFVGFRQQDSHEFLTTLLDLLDEDYKEQETEGQEEPQAGDEGEDSAEENIAEPVEEEKQEPVEEEKQDESLTESAAKRARTEEPPALYRSLSDSSVSTCQVARAPSRRAFSELGVEEIGHLLHGTPPSREAIVFSYASASSPIEPRYKLIGGRMNTADVMLTSYTGEQTALDQARTSRKLSLVREDSLQDEAQSDDTNDVVESPVTSYFKTEVRVRLTCDSCKYTRTHKETFLHLSLEIGSDSGSVESGLRRFFAPEKREIKCEKCFCATATQTSEILKLPRALLLHFKRFIVDVSPDYSSVTYRKNRSPVAFDETLSLDEHMGVLTEFLAADCSLPKEQGCFLTLPSYELRSVVNHLGSSASCGHYTADGNRYYGSDKLREWTRFNDSFVCNISAQQAIDESRNTAYMVLYELV